MPSPTAVREALHGRGERPPISALSRCFGRIKGGFGAAAAELRESLSVRCRWSGLGPRGGTDGHAPMGLAPMRAGDSAGVAVRLPSIRVDSRRFFVEKCKLVRMNHVISMASACCRLVGVCKWEALPIFW